MTTQQVADRLSELCRKGEWAAAHNELYADDAVSIEPDFAPMNHVKGLDAIREKGKAFDQMMEVHNNTVSEPVVAGNFIAFSHSIKATDKQKNEPANMEELSVYEVRDGKIVKEHFHYTY